MNQSKVTSQSCRLFAPRRAGHGTAILHASSISCGAGGGVAMDGESENEIRPLLPRPVIYQGQAPRSGELDTLVSRWTPTGRGRARSRTFFPPRATNNRVWGCWDDAGPESVPMPVLVPGVGAAVSAGGARVASSATPGAGRVLAARLAVAYGLVAMFAYAKARTTCPAPDRV